MKKKGYIVIVIILVAYLGLSLGIFVWKKLTDIYILFPDNVNLKYDGKFSILKKIPNYSFNIYEKGELLSKNKVTIKDDTILYGELPLQDDLLGIRGNVNILKYIDSNLENSDLIYLNNIMKTVGINVDLTNLSYLKKYIIDLNNDKTDEIIYALSNNWDTELGDLFSMVILKSNEDIIQFDQFSDEYEAYVPYLYFLDLKGNGKGEIILKNVYSSMMGQTIKILSFDKNLVYNTIYEEVFNYETKIKS